MSREPILIVRDLCVRFGADARPLLDRVSFDACSGRLLALVGESGAGKSVTARAVVGLLPAAARVSGSVRLAGTELVGLPARRLRRYRGAGIALALQDAARGLHPAMRVGAQIAEAVQAQRRVSAREARLTAARLCAALGFNDVERCLDAYPHELSGGMRQRAMLAIALAPRPKVLIVDEATAPLDPVTRAGVIEVVRGACAASGAAAIVISHDAALVAAAADEVLEMRHGRVRGCWPRAAWRARLGNVDAHSGSVYPHRGNVVANSGSGSMYPHRGNVDAHCGPSRSLDVVLSVRGLTHDYQTRRHTDSSTRSRARASAVLAGVSFDLHRAETLAIVGASGSGKSTLARAVLQLLRPNGGQVIYRGLDLTQLRGAPLRRARRGMQMVFQDPWASLNPRWPVAAIIAEGLTTVPEGRRHAAARRRQADALLERVGLPPGRFAHRVAGALSGGESQRVAIARAVAALPDVLVLDEPVASLDSRSAARVLDLLAGLQRELGIACLLISHDLNVVERISNRIAVLHGGHFCETGPTASVLVAPSHAWTAELISASRRFASLPLGSRGNSATY